MKYQKAYAYLKVFDNNEYNNDDNVMKLSHEDSPVLKILENDLYVSYLVDEDNHFSYVQYADLPDGVTEEDLHEIGIYNLSLKINDNLQIQQTEGIFAAFLDGNFEASLMLVDPLWDESLANLVENSFVACIPTRDILAFCDSASNLGIAKLKKINGRVWETGDHQLTQNLFVRHNGNWKLFDPL